MQHDMKEQTLTLLIGFSEVRGEYLNELEYYESFPRKNTSIIEGYKNLIANLDRKIEHARKLLMTAELASA